MYLTARRLLSDKLIHSNSCLQRACERLSCTLPAWHAAGSGWYLPPIRGSAANGGNRSVLTRPGRLMGTALLLNTVFPPAGSRGLMISRSLFSFFFLLGMCIWHGGEKKKIINLERREEEKKKRHLHASADNTPTLADNDTLEDARTPHARAAKWIYECQHQKTPEQLSHWMDAWKLGHRKP